MAAGDKSLNVKMDALTKAVECLNAKVNECQRRTLH
jgi:hypothetical protein